MLQTWTRSRVVWGVAEQHGGCGSADAREPIETHPSSVVSRHGHDLGNSRGSAVVGSRGVGGTHGEVVVGAADCRAPEHSIDGRSMGAGYVCRVTALSPSTSDGRGQRKERRDAPLRWPGGNDVIDRCLQRALSRGRRRRFRQPTWRREDNDPRRGSRSVPSDNCVLSGIDKEEDDVPRCSRSVGVSQSVVSRLPSPAAVMAERNNFRSRNGGRWSHEVPEHC